MNWLPLAAVVVASYFIGFLVSAAWGGFFYASMIAISALLVAVSAALHSEKSPALVRLSCIFIGLVELGAISVNAAAMADYYGWFGTSMAWYYENRITIVNHLFIAELLALLIYPLSNLLRAIHGGITRIYRSIRTRLAGLVLAGYGYSLGFPHYQAQASMPGMRGSRL